MILLGDEPIVPHNKAFKNHWEILWELLWKLSLCVCAQSYTQFFYLRANSLYGCCPKKCNSSLSLYLYTLSNYSFIISLQLAFKGVFLSADVGRLQLVQKMQQSIHVPALFTPEMLKTFCLALSEQLKNNTRLRSLGLIGFPFSLVHLQELSAVWLAWST